VLRSCVVLAALLLALPVGVAAAQGVPPGLSREQPISVAGELISLAEIRHFARISAWSRGGLRGKRPTRTDFELAATFLINHRWVHGEARAQGVRVTGRQVGRQLRGQIHDSFSSWREFHEFLHETRQTFADIRLRVRADMESSRLRDLVIAGITDPEEQQARLDAWVADFGARWRAQTLCTPRFAVAGSDCGNAPAA
jgi:hypothetical protein